MHIVILGAGGVGGYFGGRLAQAGQQVTFIARGEHLQAMRATGLKVDSLKGNFSINPVNATDDISTVKDIDAILLCVKTWQIPEVVNAIRPVMGLHTFVVPMENGVEAAAQLVELLGEKPVVAGLCSIFSHIVSPGYICHDGAEPIIAIGELDNCPTPRVEGLLEVLLNAGIQAEIPTDITLALWQKFMLIAGISGVGAITRVPIGQFRTQPGARKMVEDVASECYAVGLAKGVSLPGDSVGKVMAALDLIPGDTITSIQRDVIKGCPSELESLNGAIVRMGGQLGISTPVNTFVYNALLPQEYFARGNQDLIARE